MRKVFEAFNEDVVSHEEMKGLLDTLIAYVSEAKKSLEDTNGKAEARIAKTAGDLLAKLQRTQKAFDKDSTDIKAFSKQWRKELLKRLSKELTAIRKAIPTIPEMPEMPSLDPLWDKLLELEGRIAFPMTPIEQRDALESIDDEDQKLSMDAISGLPAALMEIREERTGRRNIFGVPSRGMFLYIDGVKMGLVSNLNLVAGSNMAISYSKVNGQDTITFESTGGGGSGVNVETPPESPNGVITVFTVSAEPKWVVADGITYYEGAGYSYAALEITMDVPPSASIRVIT